jgi:hypothetical protein
MRLYTIKYPIFVTFLLIYAQFVDLLLLFVWILLFVTLTALFSSY